MEMRLRTQAEREIIKSLDCYVKDLGFILQIAIKIIRKQMTYITHINVYNGLLVDDTREIETSQKTNELVQTSTDESREI